MTTATTTQTAIRPGDRVRSYDFPDSPRDEARACYVEGRVLRIFNHPLVGVDVYEISVSRDVWKGREHLGPQSRVGDNVYPPVNGLRCLLGGVTRGVVKLDDLSVAELDAVADGLLRDISTRPPLPAGREAAPVLCPGCSCEEHVLLAGPGRLFRCQGCGGIHGECDLPTFRHYVSGKWETRAVPHEDTQYVDVMILGDGRPRRWHGWVDRLTTTVVQEG